MSEQDRSLDARLASIETMLDIAIKGHGDQLKDHELRIREVQARSTVSPKALWGGLAGAIASAAALSPLLDRIINR